VHLNIVQKHPQWQKKKIPFYTASLHQFVLAISSKSLCEDGATGQSAAQTVATTAQGAACRLVCP
jgi:hypothetical protein